MKCNAFAFAAMGLIFAAPALAHHSFAMFDAEKSITLEGTVSFAPRRPTLPDSMDLTGWKVMRAGDDSRLPDAPTLREARQSLP